MEILLLCGVFAPENEKEVLLHAKKSIEFSSNQMQLKLIKALRSKATTYVLSAPFIGHFPNQSDWAYFHGFSVNQRLCDYVFFFNLWGIKNISRAIALKRKIKTFILQKEPQKLIVVFSAHDPFLAAAAYAKKKDPSIRICLVVPDLPQYMNLEAKRSKLYDVFKKYDIKSIMKHINGVDASVVLTRDMLLELHLDDRPFAVIEGIVDAIPNSDPVLHRSETINIVYAGKLYERFGIKTLVDAFASIPNSNYQLILCGDGDATEYIQRAAQIDQRIKYVGQIPPQKVEKYLQNADVLVNPRPNNEEYTRYSFPSKIIEYLLQGKPVVAYMLDGMPNCYRDYIYEINPLDPPIDALKNALEAAANVGEDEIRQRINAFRKYASEHLMASVAVEEIIRISFE